MMSDLDAVQVRRRQYCTPRIPSCQTDKSVLGTAQPERRLDQVRDAPALKHYSNQTGEAHVSWIRRYTPAATMSATGPRRALRKLQPSLTLGRQRTHRPFDTEPGSHSASHLRRQATPPGPMPCQRAARQALRPTARRPSQRGNAPPYRLPLGPHQLMAQPIYDSSVQLTEYSRLPRMCNK
jgi:hypothetical protein